MNITFIYRIWLMGSSNPSRLHRPSGISFFYLIYYIYSYLSCMCDLVPPRVLLVIILALLPTTCRRCGVCGCSLQKWLQVLCNIEIVHEFLFLFYLQLYCVLNECKKKLVSFHRKRLMFLENPWKVSISRRILKIGLKIRLWNWEIKNFFSDKDLVEFQIYIYIFFHF